jgi:hypothetical protein
MRLTLSQLSMSVQPFVSVMILDRLEVLNYGEKAPGIRQTPGKCSPVMGDCATESVDS